jgi:hypothetical protein
VIGERGATKYEYEPSAPEWWRNERERDTGTARFVVVVIVLLLSAAVATMAGDGERVAQRLAVPVLPPHFDPPSSLA